MSVVDFPGSTTQDIPVEDVCEGAKNADDVLIISWKGDDLVLAMSNGKIADALLMLKLAYKMLIDTLQAMCDGEA